MNFEIISPASREALLQCLQSGQSKNFRLAAGFTDLLIELKKSDDEDLTIINLSQMQDDEFNTVYVKNDMLHIGALVTAARLIKNTFIRNNFPVLKEAAESLASGQIRQVATVGGNICQASPSGDLSCALVSLKANCEILDENGQVREESLSNFFLGPGKTSLQKNEVLKNVIIPVNRSEKLKSGYIKTGKRNSMECSIVSIAYHFQLDNNDGIRQAGIAIGAVAPKVVFCIEAAGFLKGKNALGSDEKERSQFGELIQKAASPVDDLRATAWYRNEVLYNCALSIFE